MPTPKKAAPKKAAPKKAAPQKKQVPPRTYAVPPMNDPLGEGQEIHGQKYDPKPMIDETLDGMIASFRERLGDIQDLMEQARGAKVISLESCIIAALPGVMRRSSLEDPKVIVDQAVNIGTELFNRLEQK